jgi:hypothetical protein
VEAVQIVADEEEGGHYFPRELAVASIPAK